jgi:hypothetical protein
LGQGKTERRNIAGRYHSFIVVVLDEEEMRGESVDGHAFAHEFECLLAVGLTTGFAQQISTFTSYLELDLGGSNVSCRACADWMLQGYHI